MSSPAPNYSKTYPGGWQNGPSGGTPIDAAALNDMEGGIAGALQAPLSPASGDVPIWDPTANGGAGGWNTSTNIKIAKAMLGALGIVDADVASGAALQLSKLNGFPNDATKFARGDGVWATAIPSGAMLQYGASVAPSGWLLCDGSAVSRTTFAALFAAIGTAYGVGDGSTTFNVPDLRGRVPVGYAASGGHADVSSLNNNDGQAVANRRPKHRTSLSDPGHTHDVEFDNSGGGATNALTGTTVAPSVGGATVSAPALSHTTGISVGSGVANDALDTPSYVVVNFIIKE